MNITQYTAKMYMKRNTFNQNEYMCMMICVIYLKYLKIILSTRLTCNTNCVTILYTRTSIVNMYTLKYKKAVNGPIRPRSPLSQCAQPGCIALYRSAPGELPCYKTSMRGTRRQHTTIIIAAVCISFIIHLAHLA